jgi:hypothetical protein
MYIIWEKKIYRALRKDTVYEVLGFCSGVVQVVVLRGYGAASLSVW